MELPKRQWQILRLIADYKVRCGAPPTLGEIVVAMVDDEVTVKRFQMDGTTVILKPENEAFAPITIGKTQRFRILGKVIGVFRRL